MSDELHRVVRSAKNSPGVHVLESARARHGTSAEAVGLIPESTGALVSVAALAAFGQTDSLWRAEVTL